MSGLDTEVAIHTAPPPPTPDAHGAPAHPDATHAEPTHDKSRSVRHPFGGGAKKPDTSPARPAMEPVAVAPEPVRAPEPVKDEHMRNEFVREMAHGTTKVEYGPELKQQYAGVLSNHLNTLSRLRETNPTMLDNPRFGPDKALFESLTTDGKPDAAKIDKYLSTAEGKISANLVLENKVRLMMFGFGLDVVAHGGDQKDPMSTIEEILDKKQPVDNRIGGALKSSAIAGLGGAATGVGIQEAISHGLAGDFMDSIRTSGVDIAHLLTRFPDVRSAVIGGGLGLAGNAMLRHKMHTEGGKEDPTMNKHSMYAEGLNAIKADDDLAEYVHEMTGIVVDDFHVNTAGEVELAPGKNPSTFDIGRSVKDINNLLDTRKDFLKVLGYPEEKIEGQKHERRFRKAPKSEREKTGNDQKFTGPNAEGTKQLATLWDEDIDFEFGTLADRAGVDLDTAPEGEKIALFTKARTNVSIRFHERAIEAAQMEIPNKDKHISNIREGITKLEGSAVENKAKYQAELERMQRDTTELTSELSFTTAVADVRKQFQETVNDFQTRYAGERDPDSAIQARNERLVQDADGKNKYDRDRASQEAERDAAIDTLRSGATRTEIEARVRDRIDHAHAVFEGQQEILPQNKRRAASTAEEINAQVERAVDAEVKAEEKRITDRYESRVKALDAREDRDRQEIADLISYRKQFAEHQEAMNEVSIQEQVRDSVIEQDFAEVAGRTGDDAVDLSLTVDRLIDGKTTPSDRQVLVHARIQHVRAGLMSATGLTRPDTTGMSPEDAERAEQVYRAQYDAVHERATRQAYEKVSQELQRKTTDLTEKAVTGELTKDEKKRAEQGKLAIEMATHQTEIANRSRSVDLAKLTDNTKLTDVHDEEFSKQELAQDVPVVYHRLMNLFFDYESGHDMGGKHLGRGEYFEKIAALLPPNELAKLIDQSGVLGPPIGSDNLIDAAEDMNEAYKTNGFTQVELRRLSRFVTRRVLEGVNAQF